MFVYRGAVMVNQMLDKLVSWMRFVYLYVLVIHYSKAVERYRREMARARGWYALDVDYQLFTSIAKLRWYKLQLVKARIALHKPHVTAS